jgi:plasmid maintenance system antidote protein VapI
LLTAELQSDVVRFVDGPMSQKAYQQLMNLEAELRDTSIVYKCLPGQHDDLGISCAMLAWAARHPHLQGWMQASPCPRIRRRNNMDGAPSPERRTLADLRETVETDGVVDLDTNTVIGGRCGITPEMALRPEKARQHSRSVTALQIDYELAHIIRAEASASSLRRVVSLDVV